VSRETGAAIVASLVENRAAGVITTRPSGEIIAKGSLDREEIVMAEIDWGRVDEHRTHWPFLRDRRIDAYSGIEQRLID